jgi:hypothetical protein
VQIEDNTRIAKIRIAILNPFIFIVEMQPNLSKGSAKIRLSETNGNLFTFVSVRILYKSKTTQE